MYNIFNFTKSQCSISLSLIELLQQFQGKPAAHPQPVEGPLVGQWDGTWTLSAPPSNNGGDWPSIIEVTVPSTQSTERPVIASRGGACPTISNIGCRPSFTPIDATTVRETFPQTADEALNVPWTLSTLSSSMGWPSFLPVSGSPVQPTG